METDGKFHIKLKIETPHAPVIPSPDMYAKELNSVLVHLYYRILLSPQKTETVICNMNEHGGHDAKLNNTYSSYEESKKAEFTSVKQNNGYQMEEKGNGGFISVTQKGYL